MTSAGHRATTIDAAREVARRLAEPFTAGEVARQLPEFNHRTIEGVVRKLEEAGELEGRPKGKGRTHGVRYWRTRQFREHPSDPLLAHEAGSFLQGLCIAWAQDRGLFFRERHAGRD